MITNDEKVILKNLPEKFKYIARNDTLKGDLYIFEYEPYTWDGFFKNKGHTMPLNQFRHMFKSIQKNEHYEISDLILPPALKSLNKYHFEHDYFTKTINEIIPNMLGFIIDNGDTFHTNNFYFFRVYEEFYVVHLKSGTIIKWGKHLDRFTTNTCNKDLKDWEFVEFLKLLKEDIKRR